MKRFVGPVALVLALLLAMASLIVNGVVMYGLLRVRRAGLAAVTEARTALSGLSDRTIETTIPFHHTFPVRARVPLEQEFLVPIQMTIPISTVVWVPLEIPLLGTYQVAVPVEAQVPVDLQVVIPISQTVEVETSVVMDTEVPVQVEVGRLGLEDLLEHADTALAEMEQGLRWPGTAPEETQPRRQ